MKTPFIRFATRDHPEMSLNNVTRSWRVLSPSFLSEILYWHEHLSSCAQEPRMKWQVVTWQWYVIYRSPDDPSPTGIESL